MMDDDLENHQSAVLGDHVGKLFPKLKMNNQESVGMDQDQNQSHYHHHHHGVSICQFCNRGFRSNKALGGHLRIHYQSNPELIKKSTKATKKRNREDIVTLADFSRKINISKRNKVNGTVPECFVCSKIFPSMKSLFGHMRCHPGRHWKGIHPPPAINKTTTNYSSSSSSMVLSDVEPQDQDNNNNNDRMSNFSAAPVDLTESLFGWSATAKRGRKQLTSLDLDREILAAHELIRLAHGDGGDLFHESRSSPTPMPTLTPTSKQTVVEATNSNSLAYEAEDKKKKKKKKKKSFQELSAGYIEEGHHPVKQLSFRPVDDRKPEYKVAHDNNDDDETGKSVSSQSQWKEIGNWVYEEDESASKNTEQQQQLNRNGNGNGKVIIVKNNVKKKRKKIKDLDSVQDASPDPNPDADAVHVHQVVPAITATPDQYRCGTCDKSFPTHQALGGHRSVHNKLIRKTIHNFVAEVEEEILADSQMFEDEENKESEEGAGSSKQVDDETTTTTTNTIHKCSKKFSTGHALVGAVAPSSQEVSTSVGELSHTCGGGGGGRRVLEFDLNEAPPVEDDDAGGFKCEEHDVCGHASSSFNSVEFPVFESSSSGL